MNAMAGKSLVARHDGTLEVSSSKNHVILLEDRAIKSFFGGGRSKKRFAREVSALRRLQGLDGFPDLLQASQTPLQIQISRIPGVALAELEQVPDTVFTTLRALTAQMIASGVARHSLPARDVIVRPDGSAGLVDFERSRSRWVGFGPVWLVSRAVTRFQLLRLIDQRAPHLLNAGEKRQLDFQRKLRLVYRRYLDWRKQRRQR